MADVHSKKVRSYNMSRIWSKDTKPELLIRRFLFSKGYRYKLHDRRLPGSPDMVLPKYKTIIFIHGCFWHGHIGCKYFKVPKTRTEWWGEKIKKNKQRDADNSRLLRAKEWKIITIFECELRAKKKERTLQRLLLLLKIKN